MLSQISPLCVFAFLSPPAFFFLLFSVPFVAAKLTSATYLLSYQPFLNGEQALRNLIIRRNAG